jgi:Protein of unknown function (DUF1549)/Protein of unknown function (DUF1553)
MWSVLLLSLLAPQDVAPSPQRHWAYVAPVRPAPPRTDLAPIDAFLLAGIEANGLTPAPRADRATLLRRASLDLIGLPPTPVELDAFLADPAPEPDAFARQVDRLLASPHYGERWALPWLDLARYADTNGFNFDGERPMWRWRDWLIDALDRDLPFDRFTLLQLAGDLLPDGGDEGLLATGFHRNTPFNNEGGVDPDEARWERLLDRATTTATTWLGTTLACAQCHDHKYDPISQREFHALVAFFEPAAEEEFGPKGQQSLVLRERPEVPARVALRLRGAYDQRGELVDAGVPQALGPPLPAEAPRNRLALARWLTAPEHPLVARVHVDRLWRELFGRSLVETPEDFGVQAKRPTHLELLDWLACEFVAGGWSQKRLLRTMLLTDAYARAPQASPADRERDPHNRCFARGSRFRLAAEHLRDLQLAVSGLLSTKRGGPGVFPLQADTSGVVAVNKVDLRWRPSEGEDRHRRGIYTYWRRTATFVQFAAFDAPSREVCTVRRQVTNTPLQALAGLNDPAAWAAAQALGERMRTADGDERARLAFGFRLCTARLPTAAELARLQRALAAEDPAQAWTLIANALLNLDETLTRG